MQQSTTSKATYRELRDEGEGLLGRGRNAFLKKGINGNFYPLSLAEKLKAEGKADFTPAFQERTLDLEHPQQLTFPLEFAVFDLLRPAEDRKILRLLPGMRRVLTGGHVLQIVEQQCGQRGEFPLSEEGFTIFYIGQLDVVSVRRKKKKKNGDGIWLLDAESRNGRRWPAGTQIVCLLPS